MGQIIIQPSAGCTVDATDTGEIIIRQDEPGHCSGRSTITIPVRDVPLLIEALSKARDEALSRRAQSEAVDRMRPFIGGCLENRNA